MRLRDALPFVAPFVAFMIGLAFCDHLQGEHFACYPIRILAAAVLIGFYWRHLPPLTTAAPVLSMIVGVVGVVIWIGLDPWVVHYDKTMIAPGPFALYPGGLGWLLFGVRLVGMAVVVPVMEELFWRGFLMRWLIRDDFTTVAIGAYKPVSFALTTAFFASVHGPEWPLAVVVGLVYGAWFVRTRSLGSIMLAHGTTNFLLGLYCLDTNDWHFLSIAAPLPH